jgi:hypothetical protein
MWPFPWNIAGFLIFMIPFWLFYRALKTAQARDRSYENDSSGPQYMGPSTGAF